MKLILIALVAILPLISATKCGKYRLKSHNKGKKFQDWAEDIEINDCLQDYMYTCISGSKADAIATLDGDEKKGTATLRDSSCKVVLAQYKPENGDNECLNAIEDGNVLTFALDTSDEKPISTIEIEVECGCDGGGSIPATTVPPPDGGDEGDHCSMYRLKSNIEGGSYGPWTTGIGVNDCLIDTSYKSISGEEAKAIATLEGDENKGIVKLLDGSCEVVKAEHKAGSGDHDERCVEAAHDSDVATFEPNSSNSKAISHIEIEIKCGCSGTPTAKAAPLETTAPPPETTAPPPVTTTAAPPATTATLDGGSAEGHCEYFRLKSENEGGKYGGWIAGIGANDCLGGSFEGNSFKDITGNNANAYATLVKGDDREATVKLAETCEMVKAEHKAGSGDHDERCVEAAYKKPDNMLTFKPDKKNSKDISHVEIWIKCGCNGTPTTKAAPVETTAAPPTTTAPPPVTTTAAPPQDCFVCKMSSSSVITIDCADLDAHLEDGDTQVSSPDATCSSKPDETSPPPQYCYVCKMFSSSVITIDCADLDAHLEDGDTQVSSPDATCSSEPDETSSPPQDCYVCKMSSSSVITIDCADLDAHLEDGDTQVSSPDATCSSEPDETECPPDETDEPGETDSPPDETDEPDETQSPPDETNEPGETDSPPDETEKPKETTAPPPGTPPPSTHAPLNPKTNAPPGTTVPPPTTLSLPGGNTKGGGSFGDPHLKTWKGKLYDFHGECDLVLTQSKQFANGLGLDIHIRTEIRHDWSFISGAALRIGDDILEVASKGRHFLNGVKDAPMPNKVGGFKVTYTQHGEKWNKFVVELGKDQGKIYIKSFDEFLAVSIKGAEEEFYADAVGMMGEFATGTKIGREGQLFEDNVAFGMEWQVRDTEPKLFLEAKGPQWPQVCRMPEKPIKIGRRRLDESDISYEEAVNACKDWPKDTRDICIYDVLSTGQIEMAEAGAI